MRILKTLTGAKHEDFYKKRKTVEKFYEPYRHIYCNCINISGANNNNKRKFISNMIVNSCNNKDVLMIDTKGLSHDEERDVNIAAVYKGECRDYFMTNELNAEFIHHNLTRASLF